ncbi:glutamine-rich protein 2-like [Scleropages formosus]|uniref:glutamine-rich protein 2-like n=1 Tax=Scleropages formosus TaxID=113540 RepID=UPI0010FA7FF7|nr:glutamine-rich protein 2-like [Scleropages formosus]
MAPETSLFHLLDLCIDAPQFSTVNYSALHSLLSEILKRVVPEEKDAVAMKSVCQDDLKDFFELKQSLDGLQSEFKELQEQLSQSVAPIQDHLKDIHESQGNLQSEFNGLQEQMSVSMASVEDHLKDIYELKEYREALQSELKGLQEQLSQDHFKDIQNLKESQIALQSELKVLQEQLSQDHLKDVHELKESRGALQSELKGLQEQLSQFMAQIQDQKNEIVELKEYRDALQSEVKGLKEKLSQRREPELEPGQEVSRIQQGAICHPSPADLSKRVGQPEEQLQGVMMEGNGRTVEGSEVKSSDDLEPGHRDGRLRQEGTFTSSSVEVSKRASQQFQHDEEDFMAEGIGRTVEGSEVQELLSEHPAQASILQLQKQCEKLYDTTRLLLEGQSQQQRQIDHNNSMLQELLLKIDAQEQEWHKTTDKTYDEIDRKMNEKELELMKKKLENCWEVVSKVVQVQPDSELDNAAAIRKPLPSRFHCLSCNRRVDVGPGLKPPTLPVASSLPSHRPFHLRKVEEVQHHSQSEQILDLPVSQSCGSNQTSTHLRQRYARLHRGMNHDKENVEILGKDGHIYKGCSSMRGMEPRPPNIPKEAYSLSLRGHCP